VKLFIDGLFLWLRYIQMYYATKYVCIIKLLEIKNKRKCANLPH